MTQIGRQAVVLNPSSSVVTKLPAFTGSLATRALYIYTPPGYAENLNSSYPVIYMHDGQNVFESFVKDSFAGSWQADETADRLILAGKMRPCVIVGVSNGQTERLQEYQPPYNKMRYAPLTRRGKPRKHPFIIKGEADKTVVYYQEIAEYIKTHYRILEGREHAATCGSSMGGLFSTYMAWEYPEFAKNHAALSPSYWTTTRDDGKLNILERIRHYPKRDVRLWLDSGEGTSEVEGGDDDNKFCTLKARAALLEAGYKEGKDFVYYLAEGGLHRESSWAARLDKVFQFLMPVS
ncbi:MAG: alpha/beta hydrolase [Trueperaceae bacterium]|nr:alpha/beta hydrolase [Trueperaceae bacterium]